MNDLFVEPGARGSGAADALIQACVEAARERGATSVEWTTAQDNHRAQAVYDRVGGRPRRALGRLRPGGRAPAAVRRSPRWRRARAKMAGTAAGVGRVPATRSSSGVGTATSRSSTRPTPTAPSRVSSRPLCRPGFQSRRSAGSASVATPIRNSRTAIDREELPGVPALGQMHAGHVGLALVPRQQHRDQQRRAADGRDQLARAQARTVHAAWSCSRARLDAGDSTCSGGGNRRARGQLEARRHLARGCRASPPWRASGSGRRGWPRAILPRRGALPERAHHDVLAHVGQGEARQQGHCPPRPRPDPGRRCSRPTGSPPWARSRPTGRRPCGGGCRHCAGRPPGSRSRRPGPASRTRGLRGQGMPERERQVHRVLDERVQLDAAVEPLALLPVEAAGTRTRQRPPAPRRAASGAPPRAPARTKVSSTSGWRSLNRASAGGTNEAPAVENDARRTRPPRTPAIASSSASAAASRASTTSAWSTSARPASVSRTPRLVRSTSVAPAVFSSAAICWEIAGWV